jgi:hypothetical protein
LELIFMSRGNKPAITASGRLQYLDDRIMLMGQALGLTTKQIASLNDWNVATVSRDRGRLIKALNANGIYAVVVWAFNRRLIPMEQYVNRSTAEAYAKWLQTAAALDQNCLLPDQLDLIIRSTELDPKTIDTRWSNPSRFDEETRILRQAGLPVEGLKSFSILISAAAHLEQLRFEDIPKGLTEHKFVLAGGITVCISGLLTGEFDEVVNAVKRVLAHRITPDDTAEPAD